MRKVVLKMSSNNTDSKQVIKIDYLGPHQIATTGNESYSYSVTKEDYNHSSFLTRDSGCPTNDNDGNNKK